MALPVLIGVAAQLLALAMLEEVTATRIQIVLEIWSVALTIVKQTFLFEEVVGHRLPIVALVSLIYFNISIIQITSMHSEPYILDLIIFLLYFDLGSAK